MWSSGPAPRQSERRTFRFSLLFCGPAPRLSERRTSIFGLTSMSFVSNFGRQIFTVFSAAQRYLRDLVSKRFFRTNGIHSIRLRTTIKAGIFPFTFSIFFRETTFLESNAGGPPTGGSHRAGLVVSKKKREKEKKWQKSEQLRRISRKEADFHVAKFRRIVYLSAAFLLEFGSIPAILRRVMLR